MQTATILQHLKKHGQLLDSEIAAATGFSIEQVRSSLMELSAQGEISKCSVTTFKDEAQALQIANDTPRLPHRVENLRPRCRPAVAKSRISPAILGIGFSLQEVAGSCYA